MHVQEHCLAYILPRYDNNENGEMILTRIKNMSSSLHIFEYRLISISFPFSTIEMIFYFCGCYNIPFVLFMTLRTSAALLLLL